MPMTETMEDSLMTVTNSLPRAGRMFRMACGRTTRRIASPEEKPTLRAAAKALARKTDNGLAASQEGKRFFRTGVGLCDAGKEAACFPCLAAQAVGQKLAGIAKRFRFLLRCGAKLTHGAGDVRLNIGKRLRRFLCEVLHRLFRELQAVFLDNLHGVFTG